MEVRDGARRVVVSYSNVPLRGCGVGAIVILSPSSTQGKLREGSAIGSTADSSSPAAPQNDSAGEPGDTCEIRTPPPRELPSNNSSFPRAAPKGVGETGPNLQAFPAAQSHPSETKR